MGDIGHVPTDQAAPISADELRKLLDAATPGPWKKNSNGSMINHSNGIIGHFAANKNVKADTRLIALAPQLAAEVLARRADLAAPSAPAEVEGVTDAQKIKRMADLNWKPASQYWKEQHDAKATALTALQAEIERLRGERDAWKANAEGLAVALKVTRDDLLSALHSEFDGVWTEADFEGETASADDALAAHAKLKEGV